MIKHVLHPYATTDRQKEILAAIMQHGGMRKAATSLNLSTGTVGNVLPTPRVTPADIEAEIASEHYFTAEQGAFAAFDPPAGADVVPPTLSLLTFCVLVLRNGFTVTGESYCASPENFDAEIGRKIARQNAIRKVWPLMEYALKERLASNKEL